MIKISDADRAFLVEIIPNADRLLESDKINDILLPLDDWIVQNGYAPEGEEQYVLTPLGRKAERIYDRIYYNN